MKHKSIYELASVCLVGLTYITFIAGLVLLVVGAVTFGDSPSFQSFAIGFSLLITGVFSCGLITIVDAALTYMENQEKEKGKE